jgi:hypothetical protein
VVIVTLTFSAGAQHLPHQPAPDKRLTASEKQLVLPHAIASRIGWAKTRLPHTGLTKLDRIARSLAPDIAAGKDFSAIRQRANASLTRAFRGLSGPDVSEAAFIVMSMATKDMDDDLRMVMAEIKALTAAKKKLRDMIDEINRWISEEMLQRPGAGAIQNEPAGRSKTPTLAAQRMSLAPRTSPVIRLEYVKAPVVTPLPAQNPGLSVAELKVLQGDIQSNLDGLNELSEMTSLRLQMTMDRRSKFIATLSRMMTKISTTQDTLVQNLK